MNVSTLCYVDDDIERQYTDDSNLDLHLPQEIVPATLKKSARPAAPRRACKYCHEIEKFIYQMLICHISRR